MSQQYAWPSSLRLELEAQRLHARAGESAATEKAAPLVLARWPVFFDFFACAAAAVMVFPKVFFPGLVGWEAELAGLAVAALPLSLRPVGVALGRAVSSRYGRGVGLTGGQFILGAATTAMAFMPSHAQLGWLAVALLVACRLAQGLSAGAAWGDEPGRSGGWDLTVLSAALGLVTAGGVMAVLAGILSPADFADWGWRYPFAIGFAVNIVGLFANLRGLAVPKADIAWGATRTTHRR
jgi:MFS family permease